MEKANYRIEYIKRPLVVARQQFEYDKSQVEHVTVEAYGVIDALREFVVIQADFLDAGTVADIVAVMRIEDNPQVDKSFTAHDDATSAGCITCGNEWKSLNKYGRCSSCQQIWDS